MSERYRRTIRVKLEVSGFHNQRWRVQRSAVVKPEHNDPQAIFAKINEYLDDLEDPAAADG